MQTFDIYDKDGRLHAFEVDNALLGRRGVLASGKRIPRATIINRPLLFFSWFREDVFCEFSIGDRKFVAEEPFGDNSRYWIGTEPAGWCAELTLVREGFAQWRPSVGRFRRVLWNLRRNR